MKWLLSILCLSWTTTVLGQAQANIWYFGKKAGISFADQQAVSLSDGILTTTEGCATICDQSGKLLFYTDGVVVWNKNHQAMPNGKDLAGDPSSTQSAVAIQSAEKPNLYFLFTVDKEAGSKGFCYSIVDMQLENGLGDVVEKNNLLKTPVTEKLTAVKHRNNVDTWIIVHGFGNKAFLAYLLTKKGVQKTPVISEIGSVHDDSKGYLKASPDGTNLALAVENSNFFELFDFDNATGKVSNPLRLDLPEPDSHPYGVEFSPDGSLLYGTAGAKGKIYQYNLQNSSLKKIQDSRCLIAEIELGYEWQNWTGALQLAPDGKIYVALFNAKNLGVIEKPNEAEKACDFKEKGVLLLNGLSQVGFPTFYQSYFLEHKLETEVHHFGGLVEIGKTFVLDHVFFDVGKTQLRSQSFSELEKLVKILKEDNSLQIIVSGHTDNVGNKSDNIVLSEGRAKAVTDFFVKKGIVAQRMEYRGYGSSKPVADNSNTEGRQKNRRVEFTLLRK